MRLHCIRKKNSYKKYGVGGTVLHVSRIIIGDI